MSSPGEGTHSSSLLSISKAGFLPGKREMHVIRSCSFSLCASGVLFCFPLKYYLLVFALCEQKLPGGIFIVYVLHGLSGAFPNSLRASLCSLRQVPGVFLRLVLNCTHLKSPWHQKDRCLCLTRLSVWSGFLAVARCFQIQHPLTFESLCARHSNMSFRLNIPSMFLPWDSKVCEISFCK